MILPTILCAVCLYSVSAVHMDDAGLDGHLDGRPDSLPYSGGPRAQPPSGFGAGGFGQQAPQQQPPAPPNAGFSLGTGGGGPRGGRTPGRRRIVKARRPGGQR